MNEGNKEKGNRTLTMPEPALRALLVSHLMGHPAYPLLVVAGQNEIEEIVLDKHRKSVAVVFSKPLMDGEK